MKTLISVEDFDVTMERMQDRAAKLSRGESVEPERRVTFESMEDMLSFMTPQRVRLLRMVQERTLSMSALAEDLGRDRKSIHRM